MPQPFGEAPEPGGWDRSRARGRSGKAGGKPHHNPLNSPLRGRVDAGGLGVVPSGASPIHTNQGERHDQNELSQPGRELRLPRSSPDSRTVRMWMPLRHVLLLPPRQPLSLWLHNRRPLKPGRGGRCGAFQTCLRSAELPFLLVRATGTVSRQRPPSTLLPAKALVIPGFRVFDRFEVGEHVGAG